MFQPNHQSLFESQSCYERYRRYPPQLPGHIHKFNKELAALKTTVLGNYLSIEFDEIKQKLNQQNQQSQQEIQRLQNQLQLAQQQNQQSQQEIQQFQEQNQQSQQEIQRFQQENQHSQEVIQQLEGQIITLQNQLNNRWKLPTGESINGGWAACTVLILSIALMMNDLRGADEKLNLFYVFFTAISVGYILDKSAKKISELVSRFGIDFGDGWKKHGPLVVAVQPGASTVHAVMEKEAVHVEPITTTVEEGASTITATANGTATVMPGAATVTANANTHVRGIGGISFG